MFGFGKSIYSPYTGYYEVQEVFEDWVIESGLKVRFNTATYFTKTRKLFCIKSILSLFKLAKAVEEKTLYVVTSQPGYLIGKGGVFVRKYEEIFKSLGYSKVVILESRNQDQIVKGVRRKLRIIEKDNKESESIVGN